MTLINCSVTGNSSASGGCLENRGAALTLIGTTVSGNSDSDGTALGNFSPGTSTLTDCTVSGEHSGPSGGYGIVCREGQVTIANSTVEDFNGGGIWLDQGTMTLTGTTISGNANRGGITNASMLTMTGCTISGNNRSDYGGGVSSFGNLAMTGCTITGSTAGIGGGGMAPGRHVDVDGLHYREQFRPRLWGRPRLIRREPGPRRLHHQRQLLIHRRGRPGELQHQRVRARGLPDRHPHRRQYRAPAARAAISAARTPVTSPARTISSARRSGRLTEADRNLVGGRQARPGPAGDYGGPTQTVALQPGSPARHGVGRARRDDRPRRLVDNT